MSLSSGKVETVNVKFKTKFLWLTIGILLVLLAISPVVASYLPSSGPSTPSSAPAGGGGSSGPAVNCNNPCTIVIANSLFGTTQPTVVKAGTAITWINKDGTQHTTTSNTGLWDSGVLGTGQSFTFTFNNPGTFPYHCNIHPMTGTVVVVS
jgi:hypothetical protein